MAFDKTLPIEGALAPTYNDIMRADKVALEAALNAYMYFATVMKGTLVHLWTGPFSRVTHTQYWKDW